MIIKLKTKKYHTVRTVLKSNIKIVKKKEEAKLIPLTHIYMTAHFLGMVQALKSGGVNLVLWEQYILIFFSCFQTLKVVSLTT